MLLDLTVKELFRLAMDERSHREHVRRGLEAVADPMLLARCGTLGQEVAMR